MLVLIIKNMVVFSRMYWLKFIFTKHHILCCHIVPKAITVVTADSMCKDFGVQSPSIMEVVRLPPTVPSKSLETQLNVSHNFQRLGRNAKSHVTLRIPPVAKTKKTNKKNPKYKTKQKIPIK